MFVGGMEVSSANSSQFQKDQQILDIPVAIFPPLGSFGGTSPRRLLVASGKQKRPLKGAQTSLFNKEVLVE